MLISPELYRLLFWASLTAVAVCCAVATWFVTRNRLRPFARNLLLGLLSFELLLALIHVYIYRANPDIPPFWAFFFDLQFEYTLGAIFSAFQLTMIGMIALLNGWHTPGLPRWQRLYWVLLALTFVYLGLDEYHAYHETLGGRDVSEFWRIPYALGGAVLIGLSIAVFFFGKKTPLRLFVMIFMGLVVMGVAGIGIEEFVLQGYVNQDQSANWMYVFEEGFEMVGATIALAGVLSCMQEFVPEEKQAFSARFLAGAGVVTLMWYFFAQLLLPSLQARFTATPANVRYQNGMELVAYNIEPDVINPGDEVMVALYWRADEPQPENYSFSAHALRYPEAESIAQSDSLHIAEPPSAAWFPGVTVKHKYYVNIPRSLDAPASLGIMARVWYGPWPFLRPWEDTTGLTVLDAGEVDRFAEDAVVLDSVTALTRPGAEETPPATVTDYQFPQANVTLTGYTLPETLNRRELPLDFWWQTAGQPQDRADLSQFLHLIPQDGDEDEIYTFDRPPFNGRFPMPAWPADMRERATLSLPLDDLPAGTYDIYTGLYDWQTNTRYTVLAEGDPVQNNAIHLGSITYDPAEIAETPARDLSVYCYAVSNFNAEQNIEVDTLIAVNRETGTAELVGSMGTQEVENLAFSQDGRVLYGIAEYKEERRGQFGTIDLETGVFTNVGAAVADPPATNPVYGPDPLFDVDGIDVDRSTGRVWAVTQDAKNYLFQVDPDTGEVVRDAFGENIDYVKVDLSSLTRADFIDVEGFSIHPETGDFYIIAASEDFDSTLARIDFDTLNPAQRTVQVTDPQPFISDQDGDPILDVEGTAFGPAGTFYITNSNNSNTRQVYDSIWQVDLETGESRWIDSMENHVPYIDYESLACYAGNTD